MKETPEYSLSTKKQWKYFQPAARAAKMETRVHNLYADEAIKCPASIEVQTPSG
jgi:hypothetical protein